MNPNEFEKNDPDTILESIKKNDAKKRKGKLKIFFGMVAGVGKTYQMLIDAHNLKKEGIDVVVGFIESHGRKDTEELIKGFEVIPRNRILYKNIYIEEMDIDSILKRKPDVVLVDELAHTNIPGSRHIKRYQDVIELLDNGIDVYTTVNVQHLESRATTIEEITRIKVRETIPDSILELADKIELIDITPEELQKRLQDGKIYPSDKIKTANENFFRIGNLNALREMSLQFTAKIVDKKLLDYIRENRIKTIWKSTERILVAIGSSPYSEYLIRWTKRMSSNLNASWLAVYIEKEASLSLKEQESLNKNINLARELGAEILITSDEDIVKGIIRTAKQNNITQIIIGKPIYKNFNELFFKRSITDRLIKESGDIDIYIVSSSDIEAKKRKVVFPRISIPSKPLEYLIVIIIIALVTFLNLILSKNIAYWAAAIIYLFAVSISSGFLGRYPVFFMALLSALIWDFIFIPPKFTFYIDKIEDVIMLVTYFLVAFISGNLTSRLHLKEVLLLNREKHISELYQMIKILSSASSINEIIEKSISLFKSIFNSESAIILTDENGYLETSNQPKSILEINEKEHAIAQWAFDNKKPAGRFTETLSSSEIYFTPLITPNTTVGILAIKFNKEFKFNINQESLIETMTHQIALAIERENLSQANQKAMIISESEKLFQVILNSISHELRTPITSISFAASGLMDDMLFKNEEYRNVLCLDIIQAAERLNRTVGNLLDMARIESGKLKLNVQWYNLDDLINSIYKKIEKDISSHKFKKEISKNLPMVKFDFTLMEQVLINLLLNAVIYTPEKGHILLKIFEKDENVVIMIKDSGKGINEKDISRIFEKFYRGKDSKPGGLGLGLSICKAIVEIHGGTIHAENNIEGGSSFIIKLPLKLNK